MSIGDLNIRVFVRRVGIGATPFTWEIVGDKSDVPLYNSSGRFRTMEAAYSAGHARLVEILTAKHLKKRAAVSRVSMRQTKASDDWRSKEHDLDQCSADDHPEFDEVLTSCRNI